MAVSLAAAALRRPAVCLEPAGLDARAYLSAGDGPPHGLVLRRPHRTGTAWRERLGGRRDLRGGWRRALRHLRGRSADLVHLLLHGAVAAAPQPLQLGDARPGHPPPAGLTERGDEPLPRRRGRGEPALRELD